MFNKLRLKLTVLYAVLAGAVLLAVSVVCLSAYERESMTAFESAFESAASGVIYKLQSDKSVSQAWLAQMENDQRQIIYIEDGGVAIRFRGSWSPETPRDTLITRAKALCDEIELKLPLGSLEPISISFDINGDFGDSYLAGASIIPSGASNEIKLIMLRDMKPEYERIQKRRLITFLCALSGLAALCVTGYLYSRRAVRPAEESFKKQVEFTAMASHELKTPLSVLSATVDALKTYPQAPEACALLDNISYESVRMARLVEDLLTLARSDAGGWKGQFAPVDMDTLLISLVDRFLPAFSAKGLTLALELPDDALPMPTGDSMRIDQILTILLDNAMSYTPAGGRVVISARVCKNELRVSVEDDGNGVSDADKPRLFDRFYRSDKAHADPGHFGLGLSVARELARMHGGSVTFEDVRPHGARFVLTMPV